MGLVFLFCVNGFVLVIFCLYVFLSFFRNINK